MCVPINRVQVSSAAATTKPQIPQSDHIGRGMADEVESALTKYEIVSIKPADILQKPYNQIRASPDGRFAAVWNSIPAGQGYVREAQIIRLHVPHRSGFKGYHHLTNIPPGCTLIEDQCSWADSTTFFMMDDIGLWACIYRYNAGTDSFDIVKEWDIDNSPVGWFPDRTSIQCYSSRFNDVIVGAGNSIGTLVLDNVTLTYRFVGMLLIPNTPDWSARVACTMYDNYIYVTPHDPNDPNDPIDVSVLVSVNDWDTSWTILHSFPHTDILDVCKDRIYLHVSDSGVIRPRTLPDLRVCDPPIPCNEGQDYFLLEHGKFLTKINSETDVHTVYASNTADVIARYKLPSRAPVGPSGLAHSFMHGGCWAVCGVTLSNMQGGGTVAGLGGHPELYVAVVRMLCTVCGKENEVYDGRWDTVCKTCKRWKADVAVALMCREGGSFPHGPDGTLLGLNNDVLGRILKMATEERRSSARLSLLLI